ncbi:hypothetical protein [Pontitalea aquivivens]|uniref:hypothetical protein n=1 Tax=Pontitalea aquivivens TaxID=3388663 RepID=UPI003970FAF5
MALKIGDSCYRARLDGTRIEYWEYVLRTIRTRHGVTYGYWWCKLPGVTWGKLSPKHGDYGWLPNAWTGFRDRKPIDKGRPHAASKAGALRDEIASLRGLIVDYGADCHFDDDDGPTLAEQLKSALAAQKRLRQSKSATSRK